VTVEYFRSRSPPNPHHTSAKAESWVSSLAWYVPFYFVFHCWRARSHTYSLHEPSRLVRSFVGGC
jgi:hypothetical protein